MQDPITSGKANPMNVDRCHSRSVRSEGIRIRIGFETVLDCPAVTPLLLSLLPHSSYDGSVTGSDTIRTYPQVPLEDFVDVYGNRSTRLVAPAGRLRLWSDCIIDNCGEPDPYDWNAAQHEIADLPSEALHYLLASRYCQSDLLVEKAWALFGHEPAGWARIQAICNWVHNHLTFGYHFGRTTKTAVDTMRERTGVCRDFAHLAIALCRAMNIPARYAAGYLGDIGVPASGPGDFCAWFEAFIGGRWYALDARYNTPRIGRVPVVRGRDAADAAMITSFGDYDMHLFRVWADEIPARIPEHQLRALLASLPDAPALTLAPAG